MCVCVCVCVCERERESVCVCVCTWVREGGGKLIGVPRMGFRRPEPIHGKNLNNFMSVLEAVICFQIFFTER